MRGHLWAHYALPEDQSGLPVLPPEAPTLCHHRLVFTVTINRYCPSSDASLPKPSAQRYRKRDRRT